MSFAKRILFLMLLVGGLMSFTTPGYAQFRGSLHGTVSDSQGAVVSGASVSLVNPATNQTMQSTTNDNGIFQFNALPPANYQATITATGFKQKVLKNIQIIPEQPNALDVSLEVGGATETVTVTDATPLVDTATANIAGTISTNQIQNMPSFGRDVFKLVQLAPGVFSSGAQDAGGGGFRMPGSQGPAGTGGATGIFQTENGPQASAVGQQYENNSYSIDGVNTTSAVWGGTTIITPTQDSVSDVKVLSNIYDAEYGRYSGAQVQVTTKSGTNRFHGSIFSNFHRPGLNAYQPTWIRPDGSKNTPIRDNSFFTQVGGSIGGPIWKDKIFAFFAYETNRVPAGAIRTDTKWYETAAFRQSAPNGSIAAQYLNFPGAAVNFVSLSPESTCANAGLNEGVNCRTISGQGLDIGSPLTSGLGMQDPNWTDAQNPGLGNGLDGVADIAYYNTQYRTHSVFNQYTGRVDANITNKDRLAFSMYWVPQSSTSLNGPARDYNLFNHDQVNNAFALIWNRTFSPSFLNEFRFNAAGWRWNEVESNPQSPVGLPSAYIERIGSIELEKFGPNVGSILNQWTYAWKDVATKVTGRHTIKFGGELTRLFYLNAVSYATAPSYRFFNVWAFLNDAPHQESGRFDPNTGVPTLARQDDRQSIWGLFVQDDFKLRSNLTLNLGLRWNYFSPLRAKQDNMFVAYPGSGPDFLTGLKVAKGDSWDAQKDNFGPQIGFAWSPGVFDDKLVVRGGYGLSYNQLEIALSANVSNNPGLVTNPTFTMATPASPNPGIVYAVGSDLHSLTAFPANPNARFTYAANGLPANGAAVNVTIFPRDFPTTRVHHWSLQTEYQFARNYVFSLGYQGSASRNLVFHQHPNAAAAAKGFTLNPQIGGGDFWDQSGFGNYNAMLVQLRHQFSHGFLADAQFTWAHSLDTASGPYYQNPYPYDPGLNYGNSDYNVGKALKLYALWQPEFFKGNSLLDKIAGGWTISGIFNIHSGYPWSPVVSVTGGNLYCGTCGPYNTLYPTGFVGSSNFGTSNDDFLNGFYPNTNHGTDLFTLPTYTAYSGSNYGSALPQTGLARNALTGPGYKNLDVTLAKAFTLPSLPVLGEAARFKISANAYNVFNNLNWDPGDISNNIASANFGQARSALSGRVVTLEARFEF